MVKSLPLILLLLVPPFIQGKLLQHTFHISFISGAPDGVLVNHILGINGNVPGPTIEGEVGDTVEVTVVNQMQDGGETTIHWHGFHHIGTPFNDGPNMITQCSIKAGSSQVYRFTLENAGTYWYHAHSGIEATSGLWGAIISRRVPEVHKYDEEILIRISDWYHKSYMDNQIWFLQPNSTGQAPYPDSVLMNGMGRYPCPIAERKGMQCLPELQRRSHFNIVPGKRYRIRVMSASAYPAFNFSIDGHKLGAIEVDTTDLKGLVETDVAVVDSGQRYSFILDTRNTSYKVGSRFLIRAQARTDFLPLNTDGNINEYPEVLKTHNYGTATAILEYGSTGEGEILSETSQQFDYTQKIPEKDYTNLELLNERLLTPYHPYPFPDDGTIATRITTALTFGRREHGVIQMSFNNTPYVPSSNPTPLLVRMLDGDDTMFTESNQNIYVTPMGTGVEIIVNNPNRMPHPLHLHGHHFFVVNLGRAGDGLYDEERHRVNAIRRYRRDTATVQGNSYIVLRWMSTNPGFWPFHCHMIWHVFAGMLINFAEAVPEARERLSVPDDIRRMCK